MLTFNSLEYFETLIASGIQPEQARAQTKALCEVFESTNVATKMDILKLKIELIKWVIAIGISFASIMFILLRLMLPS